MQYRAFHFSLPQYLIKELERDIQKKAMSIICPGVSYHEALVIMNFKELATHHDEICESLFHTIVNENNKNLYKLLPAPQESICSLGWFSTRTERERHLTTGKRAERCKLDYRYPICRSAIGQSSCLICSRSRQQTSPFCCLISLLRRARRFNMPRFKTDRFKNSFIIFSCLKATNL